MSDPRLTPANGRVAAVHLQGQVAAHRFVVGDDMAVTRPVVDILESPMGKRSRQLLLGAVVRVFETLDGWSFVQSRDGYVGYIAANALGETATPTHFVATPATHTYEGESFKSKDQFHLSFGAKVTVLDERQKVFETNVGFVPKKHLRPIDQPFADPVTAAQLHFGVPYLWGGNSILGIDCSGLVAAGLAACGISCPADSDLQLDTLGEALEPDAPLERGDLIFWQGHVGMMVDAETLIHANAHNMAAVYEPIDRAILRIEAQGDGGVIARKRLMR